MATAEKITGSGTDGATRTKSIENLLTDSLAGCLVTTDAMT